MKKTTLTLAVLLTAFLITATKALAQNHESSNKISNSSPTRDTNGWIQYKSDEGRYVVSMPAEPQLSTQESTNDSGLKFTQYMATTSNSGHVYMIGYFDFPASFDFDKARDGIVGALKATVENETAISLGGYAGRELKMRSKEDGVEYIIRVRLYAVKNRAYFVQFITDASATDPSVVSLGQRYFDSFSVSLP